MSTEQTTDTVGVKDDRKKLMFDLIPWGPITGLVKVLTFGAMKYAPDGWKSVPNPIRRYKAAFLRHWAALEQGQFYDVGEKCLGCAAGDCKNHTGLPHIHCCLCNVVFLSYLLIQERLTTHPAEKERLK